MNNFYVSFILIFESDCLLNISVSDNLVKNYLQCRDLRLAVLKTHLDSMDRKNFYVLDK